MRGTDPTDRRRRIGRRFALGALAVGMVTGTGVAGAQEPPLLTTTTTEAPEETTTTTEAPEEVTTTTTQRSTATTGDVPTTTADEDDDVVVDDDDEVVDEGETQGTEPEPTSTTLRDLLVPGDGSDGAESTTTTSTTVAQAGDEGIDEETQVWLIVAGLVTVALLIGAWTVRYWRRTRPVPPEEPAAQPDATTVFGTP